jgi:hypothetical protein
MTFSRRAEMSTSPVVLTEELKSFIVVPALTFRRELTYAFSMSSKEKTFLSQTRAMTLNQL